MPRTSKIVLDEVALEDLWRHHPEHSTRAIAELFGVHRSAIEKRARDGHWGHRPRLRASPIADELIRALWEGGTEMTAKQIGQELGVTKNVVIGRAHRRGWKRPGAVVPEQEPSNIFARMDALNAMMDRVLAETRPFVEDRLIVKVAAE